MLTNRCPDCFAAAMDELHDEHTADLLEAQRPADDQEATDAEWWAWVLAGGRD